MPTKNPRSVKLTSTIRSRLTSATCPPTTTKSPSKSEEAATELSTRYRSPYAGSLHPWQQRPGVRHQDKLQYCLKGVDLCRNGLPAASQKSIELAQAGEPFRAPRHYAYRLRVLQVQTFHRTSRDR